MRALMSLIPSLEETPVKDVPFNPVAYLNGDTMPTRYPDSVMKVILTALQVMHPTLTLDDINQNLFTGNFKVFLTCANSEKSISNTRFVDQMRGVGKDVRDATKQAQKSNIADRGRGKHSRTPASYKKDTSCKVAK